MILQSLTEKTAIRTITFLAFKERIKLRIATLLVDTLFA